MDISDFTVEQLEALCFRLIEQRDNVQQNLSVAQAELAKRRQAATEARETGAEEADQGDKPEKDKK